MACITSTASIVADERNWCSSSRGAAAMAELGALKRFGRPEEIAELLAFCAGAKPGFLTGSDIICDGGSTAAMSVSTMIDMARRH